MNCRALALVGLLSACFDDVPVVEVSGRAGMEITPPIPAESTDGLATYRWEVVEAVDGSFVSGTTAATPRATFRFDRRGPYLLDRWIVSGLSERLTHHVVITVSGAAPVAQILGSRFVAVGETVEYDGGFSSSIEDRPLSHHWQLVGRPGLSQARLPPDEVDAAVVSLVPDVAGAYAVQLRVFDGELWSEPVMIALEAHD